MRGRKKYKAKPRFYIILLIVVSIVGFVLFKEELENIKKNVKWNFNNKQQEELKGNYALIVGDQVYLNYSNKIVIKVNGDIYVNKDQSIKDIIARKNYQELINLLNNQLTEKVKDYQVIEEYKNENVREIPLLNVGDKKFINTYELSELMIKDYYEIDHSINSKLVVDILNANGVGGYAGKTGQKLQDKFGYSYTAANYEDRTDYTYIINKSMSEQELLNMVSELNEKHIRLKEDSSITTLASAIIILGKDRPEFDIAVITNKVLDNENYNKLKSKRYQVKRYKEQEEIKEDTILYNKEDYYIAYKISNLLGIKNIKEDNNLKNKIEVKIKGGQK